MTQDAMVLVDERATAALGARLAEVLLAWNQGLVVSLAGELGAGKTALARATLRGLGHDGRVGSPSYTLVEPYPLAGRCLYHMDLYRLADPEELEFLGVRDIDPAKDWMFVEWADHGTGFLPAIDLVIRLCYADIGRKARFTAENERGSAVLSLLQRTT